MKQVSQDGHGAVPFRRVNQLVRQIEIYRSQLSHQNQELDEARAELRDSVARYDELYDLSPVGFLSLDRRGCIRELNEGAARLLGFPGPWLVGRPLLVFVAKPDLRRFLALLTRSLRHSEAETIKIDLFLDRRTVPVQVSLQTLLSSGVPIQRMTIIDLSDIRKVENQLQEALDNWAGLVQNAPDVIMTVNRDGRIQFVNRPVWGLSARALHGTRITDYVPAAGRSKIERCLKKSFAAHRATCELRGVNGEEESWFSLTFGASSGRGADTTTTVIVREISENKRAEATLRSSGERLREFAARLEAVREEERTRVAREIHDELGQALTVLKLDLSWLRSKTPRQQKEGRKKLDAMMHHVDETIERVRRISSALRPSVLDHLGLVAAIEWQVSEFRKRTGIPCDFKSSAEPLELSPETAAAVFRVVQEALTNVVRHAKAAQVCIGLKCEGDALLIEIVDNGRGATQAQIHNLKSLGVVGMKERIGRIGGQFNIHSRPSKGTRIEITIPTHHD